MAGGPTARAPVGAVLTGGAGRRLGGDKAVVELEGRALVLYPLETLHEVCDEVAVVAKRHTILPSLTGLADLWIEPDEPRHPLCGVVHALRAADGRAVLVVAADLPLLDGATLRALLHVDRVPGAQVVMPRVHGRLEPFCALYEPEALEALEGFDPEACAADVVMERLVVHEVQLADPGVLLNVDRPEDLLAAAAALSGGFIPPR
jgi:molybdopterin-guanine dinucleotide biosynthesis protein A